MKKYILTLLAALSINYIAFSQEDSASVYNEDIIVRTIFDPVVNEAFKINEKPQIYETKFDMPAFQYEKTTKQFPTTMVFEQIKPAKVKGEPLSKLYNSHIKAGVGSYFSSLVDLSYTQKRSKDFIYSTHFRHNSSLGQIENYGNSTFANNDLTLYAKKIWKKFFLDAGINYNHQQQYFYGFIDSLNIDKKTYVAPYHNVGGFLKYKSIYRENSALHNSLNFAINHTFNKWGRQETFFTASADLHKNFKFLGSDKQNIGLNLNYNLSLGKYEAKDLALFYNEILPLPFDNTLSNAAIRPYTNLNLKNLKLNIALDFVPTFGNRKEFMILPSAYIETPTLAELIKIKAGIISHYDFATLNQLRIENPYLSPLARIESNNQMDIFAKVNFLIKSNILLSIKGGYKTVNNDYFYQFDQNAGLNNMFTIVYDDSKTIYAQLDAAYQIDKKFDISLNLLYQNITTTELEFAWYKPKFKANLLLHYNANDKFNISLVPSYQSKVKCLNPKGEVEDLKHKIDVNLWANYNYNDKLSFFLELNNIAYQRYFDYYNYPSQRIVVMGGAKYSF
ncbi:MAG: TonB-dependent receptor [Bacteroidales bacterium]|nr:TonB-dependent receptor [Bacteroidales bacterium]